MEINLNDRATLTELDPSGMLSLIEGFPQQCRKALEIALEVEPPALETHPSIIAVAGTDTAAACGDFVRALFEAHGGAAFVVARSGQLPGYIGVGDVVFCVSYSGDTEEALSAYQEAKKAGAKIVAVTSGGKLKELASEDGFTTYEVPAGQPTFTLGYLFVPILVACHKMKVLPEQPIEAAIKFFEKLATQWAPGSDDSSARDLAKDLQGTVPIFYGLGSWQGFTAGYWRSLVIENAKQLAFKGAFSDVHHNEILGWNDDGTRRFARVFLEDPYQSNHVKTREALTERHASGTAQFRIVRTQGDSLLEKILWLAYFGDFVSYYLACLNSVDPSGID